MQYCWNANGYALMYKSGIVQKDELVGFKWFQFLIFLKNCNMKNLQSRLMQCTDPSFTHKHFTNMVLALWMLTVTQVKNKRERGFFLKTNFLPSCQFMVKRRTELQLQQKNLNEKEVFFFFLDFKI